MRPDRAGPRVSISVVTVTNRPGSIDVTWAALRSQTFTDFEWVLCDELYGRRRCSVAGFVDDPRLRHIPAPVAGGDLWNLNKSYNEALRHCRGELVVSLQDYIWVRPDGLARFWEHHRARGRRTLVSGVGNAYAPPPVGDPVGEITIFESRYDPIAHCGGETPCTGRDARYTGAGGVEPCGPESWELNWGSAPLQAFYDIGGFPEEHDREFVSCDNLSVAYGAQACGYEFLLDHDNECHLIDHRQVFSRPGWEELHGKRGSWERWLQEWSAQGCPQFPYLSAGPQADPQQR